MSGEQRRPYHRRRPRTAFLGAARRAAIAVAVAVPLCVGATAAAEAKTVSDFWQVSVQMPPQLWDDAASLPFLMGDAVDSFTDGGTDYAIRWSNAAISQKPKYMLRQQGAPYGAVTAGLYDRPLTPAQLTKYQLKQRLLWLDADVLIAEAGSPMCLGLTSAQLDGVLGGEVTDWRTIFPAWPAGVDPAVRLTVPTDRLGAFRWAFGRTSFAPATSRSTDAGSLGVKGGQVAVQKLSYAGRYLAPAGLCAIPVDGVAPSEETSRSLTYPFAYGVYYVSRTNPSKGPGGKPAALIARWESLLFGAKGDEYLSTWMGRARILP